MKQKQVLLDKLTKLISETMGKQTGQLFYKFHVLEDDEEVLTGARSLLIEFIGPEMTEKKLKSLGIKS